MKKIVRAVQQKVTEKAQGKACPVCAQTAGHDRRLHREAEQRQREQNKKA